MKASVLLQENKKNYRFCMMKNVYNKCMINDKKEKN